MQYIHKIIGDSGRRFNINMSKSTRVDLPLLIIIVLLATTVTAFAAGYFPYPFGLFILGFALLGRVLQLKAGK